jgi:predicted aspartyl protease
MVRNVGAALPCIAGMALLLGLAGCAGAAEPTDACAVVHAGSFPVEFRDDVPTVRVQVNGQPADMILDTGATVTMVTQNAADRLRLPQSRDKTFSMVALGGNAAGYGAVADQFRFAGVSLADHPVVVLTGGLAGFGDPAPDGLLGNDILSRFDVDFDLPRGRVTLYRRRDCPTGTPPWLEPATRVPRPANAPSANRIHLPTTLDGQAFVAFLDSGASASAVHFRAAHLAGVTAQMLANDPEVRTAGITPGVVTSRAHRFRRLQIGDTLFTRPTLVVTDLRDAGDMVIGVAFMRHHRIWMSYASQVLFLGPLVDRQASAP